MLYEYLLLFFCTIPLTMLASPGLALLFDKAGIDKNKAYIPVVNQLTMLKLTGKHPLNLILEYVPIINIISYVLDLIDFIHCYNKKTFWQQMATLFGFPIYFFIIGKDAETEYLGTLKEVEAKQPKSKWYSSLLFAVVAATIVRWAFIEAYKIPTSSMEGSMLVNDFLFVSKVHYGARTPKTPLQLPLTHQTVPFLGFKSYSTAIQLPSFRLPGFTEIQRGKPMVFNFPYDNITNITDMKTFYVKRCVGIAGDTVSFVNGQLFVNNEKVEDNENIQYKYKFKVKENIIRDSIRTLDGNGKEITVYRLKSKILDDWKIVNNEDINPIFTGVFMGQDINGEPIIGRIPHKGWFLAALNKESAEIIKKSPIVIDTTFQKIITPANEQADYDERGVYFDHKISVFPYTHEDILAHQSRQFIWNVDNFGPLWIPQKGVTIEMNVKNMHLYANTIARYEGFGENDVHIVDSKLYIKGELCTKYTFKQNYYWLCGDNRHNSYDSRYWGFVPEDHVVGKPFLTFMSLNKYNTSPFNKIRWNRIFRFVE